jgi:hypothetical protein
VIWNPKKKIGLLCTVLVLPASLSGILPVLAIRLNVPIARMVLPLVFVEIAGLAYVTLLALRLSRTKRGS